MQVLLLEASLLGLPAFPVLPAHMWLAAPTEARAGPKGKEYSDLGQEEWAGAEDVARVWACEGWMVRILGSSRFGEDTAPLGQGGWRGVSAIQGTGGHSEWVAMM